MKSKCTKILLILVIVLSGMNKLWAQPCPENPYTKKGTWVHENDGGFNYNNAHPEALKTKKISVQF